MGNDETISVRVAHYEAQCQALGIMAAGLKEMRDALLVVLSIGEEKASAASLVDYIREVDIKLTPLLEDLRG